MKDHHLLAFTLIVTGYFLQCVPIISDTVWFEIVAWICFYIASLIIAFKSKELGKKYGASHLVVGIAAISFSVLLCKIDIEVLCQTYKGLTFYDAKIVIAIIEVFALILTFLSSWGLVVGIWNFMHDFLPIMKQKIKRLRAKKSKNDDTDGKKNIEVSDINDYLGLIFVILQIFYFFLEK